MAISKEQYDKKKFTKWEKQLKDAIEQSGMSLTEVAESSGVDYSQLWRFLQSEEKITLRRTITLRTAEKLAAVVGLELKPKKEGRR